MTSSTRIEAAQKKTDRTAEFQKRARALRADGYSYSAIAQQFGMSESSVRLLLRYPA